MRDLSKKMDFAKKNGIQLEIRTCGRSKDRAERIKIKKRWDKELLGDHFWEGLK